MSAGFDIMVCIDDRWTMLGSRQNIDDANTDAARLQGDPAYDRIEVRSGRKVLVSFDGGRGKSGPITIAHLDKMPVWKSANDAYSPASRLAMGKLLRKYLDQQTLTPTELLHNGAHLRHLANQDQLYYQAVNRMAELQASAGKGDAQSVGKNLHAMLETLQEKAKDADKVKKYSDIADNKGLGPALHVIGKDIPPEDQTWYGRQLLSRAMGQSADWQGKLCNLLSLAENAPGPAGMRLLDEGLAEIMDGGRALNEILGQQPSLAAALNCMVRLGRGDYKSRDETLTRVSQFCNSGFAKELPGVLTDRAERELRSTNPLVKDPKADPEAALITLIDGIVGDNGVHGGASMAEALAERTRITIKDGYNDLTMPQAIDAVTRLAPEPAAKINFNLDMAQSDAGRANQKAVANNINKTINAVEDVSELLPADVSGEAANKAYDRLRERLDATGLPEKVCTVLDERLESKAADSDSLPDRGKGGSSDAPEQENRRRVKKDTYLFHEGDSADEVYLISSGKVAILKEQDAQPKLIAMLGRGQILGEMALIDNAPRSASAKAMEDTELVVIHLDAFQQRLDRLNKIDPVLRRLMNVFVDRLRAATG